MIDLKHCKIYWTAFCFLSRFFVFILLDDKVLQYQTLITLWLSLFLQLFPTRWFLSISFSFDQKAKRVYLCKIKLIVNQGKLDTAINQFSGNNLIIPVVLIWHLLIVTLQPFLPVLTHSAFIFFL